MSYGVGLRNGVAFALGTIPSLTSGGGLRPSLLLDFLSGSLDPRITFSRGTQAMQYGSDGTLQYAPNNLLTYSNQADNAAWTKSNSFVQTNLLTFSEDFTNAVWLTANTTITANQAIAPNGTLTAEKIEASAAAGAGWQTYQALTNIGAGAYCFSVYALQGSGPNDANSFVVSNATTVTIYAALTVNYATGVVTQTTGTGATATSVGNGWWRIVIPFTSTATLGNSVRFNVANAGTVGVPGVYMYAWGAQLVQGSVPGNYQATTSAALPVLYADYNGALRARKLCENTTATIGHRVQQSLGTLTGSAFTFSEYLKAGERTWAYLRYDDLTTTNFVWFNLATGAVGSTSMSGATIISGSISNAGNGYYRCTATVTNSGFTNTVFGVGPATGDANQTYTGDGSSGIYIADAQLTPGYLPLAVTETTSAAVYGPRFDYDPSSLVTQNLLLYSQAFENVVWGAGDATHVISANSVTAPDGTLTADVWTFPASSGAFGYNTQIISSPNANQALTFSVWARVQSGTKNIKLRFSNVTVATVSSADIALTTTWQRISYTIAAGTLAATTQIGVGFYLASSNSLVAGDLVELWGAQLNYGSTALPYTATTTAPYTLTTARGLLIEEQRTNLATFSNTFSDASWVALGTKNVAASAIISPEGVANASTLTDSSAVAFDGIQKSVAVAADGTTYTGSIYILKTAGGTSSTFGINLLITGGTTVTNNPRINTDTGAVLAGTATVTNAGLWWRVSCSVTNNSSVGNTTLAMQLYPATAAYNTATDSAAATGSATIYGAQIETGAFATSYIPTVGSTATRNADSASITTLTPWYNAAAGTWYAAFQTSWSGLADSSRWILGADQLTNKRMLYISNGTDVIATFDGTSTLGATGDITGSLAKAASTYTATTRSIAVNGGAVVSGAIAAGFAASTSINIGLGSFPNSQPCGWISAVRYYPTALPNASLQSITV